MNSVGSGGVMAGSQYHTGSWTWWVCVLVFSFPLGLGLGFHHLLLCWCLWAIHKLTIGFFLNSFQVDLILSTYEDVVFLLLRPQTQLCPQKTMPVNFSVWFVPFPSHGFGFLVIFLSLFWYISFSVSSYFSFWFCWVSPYWFKSSCCCWSCWLMFDYDLHPPSRAEKISEEGYEIMHSAVEVFWTWMWDCCCSNCFSVWFLCFLELGSIFLLFAYICHKSEISIAFIVFSKLVSMWWNSRIAVKVIYWPCTVRMILCNIWLSIEILLYDVMTFSLPLPLPFPSKWFFWACGHFVSRIVAKHQTSA